MYTLVLMLFMSSNPSLTAVDMIGTSERCQAMGEQFVKEMQRGARFVCLKR